MRPGPGTKRVIAALAAATLTGGAVQALDAQPGSAGSREPARYRHLPAQVFSVPGGGKIAVGAPTPRTVMIQDFDAGSGTWDGPSRLYSRTGVTCGEIDGRTSPGGVALLLECDAPYYEDQAPVESVALVSTDLSSWAKTVLPGEAYRAPGISPSGEHAVWLAGQGFVTWSADDGFSRLRATTYDGDTSDPTAVVADDGTVTVAGPDFPDPEADRCTLGLHEVTPAGATSVAYVDFAPGAEPGCYELDLQADSSTRISNGRGPERAGRFVVGRADESTPWALLERAPDQAPGLETYRGGLKRRMPAVFSDVPGQPLLSVGSADRRRIAVQAYDSTSQAWGPARVVYDHGFPGCTWSFEAGLEATKVHHLLMYCYPKRRASGDYPPRARDFTELPRAGGRVLLSVDGERWRSVRVGRRLVTEVPDGSLVAVPAPRRTLVASPEGVASVPVRATGRCDLLFPIGPRRLLRIDATADSRGWPSRLQRSTASGWKTIQRISVPERGACRTVFDVDYGAPSRFYFRGGAQTRALRIERSPTGWRAVRVRAI